MVQTSKDAAVIIKSQFIESPDKQYKDYINYIDRKEAKSNKNFADYNDYMANDKKTTSLFTQEKDNLNNEDKEELKNTFKLAQKRGSILWQDVISFDNKWLEENGMYNRKTNNVDEDKLKNITRLAAKEMLDDHCLDENAIWSAAIHYNTDNIHIHLATVEVSPKTSRGVRRLSVLNNMKSKYVNKIMDRSAQHEKINDIIRNKIVNDKKEKKPLDSFSRKFKNDFMNIYNQLPKNKRYWNYGYENINHIKPQLNDLTKRYIDKYYKKEYKELVQRLDDETEVLKKAYGKGQKNKYKDYKQNKIDDLYKRMGNAFLKEMKEYDKKVNTINEKYKHKSMRFRKAKQNVSFKQIKYGIDRIIYSELQSNKNQAAYIQHLRDIERGQSM